MLSLALLQNRSVLWSAASLLLLLNQGGCGVSSGAPGGSEEGDSAWEAEDLVEETRHGTAEIEAEDVFDLAPEVESPSAAVITEVIVKKHPAVGLAAAVTVRSDKPARVEVTLEDVAAGTEESVPYFGEAAVEHVVIALGLRAQRDYLVHVVARDEAGNEIVPEPRPYTAEKLPKTLPVLKLHQSLPDRMNPGYTYISGHTTAHPTQPFVMAVDSGGEVVWYMLQQIEFMHLLDDDGRLLAALTNGQEMALCGFNLLGKKSGCFGASSVGAGAFHHDFALTPEGTILALGIEMRTVDGYTSDDGPVACNVVGDVIFELSMAGEALESWHILDLLDPHRLGHTFEDRYWDVLFGGSPGGTRDWSHGNSVALDTEDDTLVVSLLGQGWVVKIDRSSGELVWRLGVGGDFTLVDGGRWFTMQHSARPGPGETVLLYDNVPAEPPFTARVVEYQLDRGNGADIPPTARQVWEYQADPPAPAQVLGNVQVLPGGNILVVDGSLDSAPELHPAHPENHVWGRVVEVERGEEEDVEVFHLDVLAQEGAQGGIQVFQALRIPTLYPPVAP